MTMIKDMPVLASVPAGGYVLISAPTANPSISIFSKIPASVIGGTEAAAVETAEAQPETAEKAAD